MYKIERDGDNKICTIHLEGVISLKSAITLKEQIIKESETGYNNIVLDFNGNYLFCSYCSINEFKTIR